jgi:hypothetical protein
MEWNSKRLVMSPHRHGIDYPTTQTAVSGRGSDGYFDIDVFGCRGSMFEGVNVKLSISSSAENPAPVSIDKANAIIYAI